MKIKSRYDSIRPWKYLYQLRIYGYRKCSSINGLNVFVSLVFSLIMAGHIDRLRLQNYKRGLGHRLEI